MESSITDKSFHLVLYHQDEQVTKVQVHSTRPLEIQNIMIGRPPEDVCPLLAKCFLVDSFAQKNAALLVLNQAYGQQIDRSLQKARALLVYLEQVAQQIQGFAQVVSSMERIQTGLQGLNRLEGALFGGLPAFQFGSRQVKPDFGAFQEELQVFLSWFDQEVLGLDRTLLDRLVSEQLVDWVQHSEALGPLYLKAQQANELKPKVEFPQLPWISIPDWHKTLDSPEAIHFSYLPTIQEQCQETGPFARQQQTSAVQQAAKAGFGAVGIRSFAQIVDLVAGVNHLEQAQDVMSPHLGGKPSAGSGFVQLEATRGRLVHRVLVSADKISQYQIIAPAEWNFHPKGVVTQGLLGASTKDREVLTGQINAWCRSIDLLAEPQIQIKPLDNLR